MVFYVSINNFHSFLLSFHCYVVFCNFVFLVAFFKDTLDTDVENRTQNLQAHNTRVLLLSVSVNVLFVLFICSLLINK